MGVENEAPFDIKRFNWWVVSNQGELLGILANKNYAGRGLGGVGRPETCLFNLSFYFWNKQTKNK